ncbi:hypothetical protein ACF1DY_21570 [Streptomyces albus]
MRRDEQAGPGRTVTAGDALLLAAGAAELAADGLARALGRVRELLNRADLDELATEGRRELKARGQLVFERLAAGPAHLEILAQHAAARRTAPAGDD